MEGAIQRAIRRGAVLVAAGAALCACGLVTPREHAPPPSLVSLPAEPAPAPMAQPLPPRPAHKPAPPETATLQEAEPTAPPQPETGGSFDRLDGGLDRDAIVTLLGQPQQRADSPPAVVWRYASRDCELDVYFYLDLQSREMRALHHEVRSHDDRPQQQCYGEFFGERHAGAEPSGSTDRPR